MSNVGGLMMLCWVIWTVSVAGMLLWRWRFHPRATVVALAGCGLSTARFLEDAIFWNDCCEGWSNGSPGTPLLSRVYNLVDPVFLHLVPLSLTLLTVAAFIDRGSIARFVTTGWNAAGRPLTVLSVGLALHVAGRVLSHVNDRFFPRVSFEAPPSPLWSFLAFDYFLGNGIAFTLVAYGVLAGRAKWRDAAATQP